MKDIMDIGNDFEVIASGANPDKEKFPVTVDLFTPQATKAYTLNLTCDVAEQLRDALDDALGDCFEAERSSFGPDPDEAYDRLRDERMGF